MECMLDDPRLSDYSFALKHCILSSFSFLIYSLSLVCKTTILAQIITQIVSMTQKVTLGHTFNYYACSNESIVLTVLPCFVRTVEASCLLRSREFHIKVAVCLFIKILKWWEEKNLKYRGKNKHT